MSVDSNTPVIVGVGQFAERIEQLDYQGMAPADLAAKACQAAIADSGAKKGLWRLIDTVAAVRTSEDSGGPCLFGKPDNFPRAVCHRLGANPKTAILSPAGGQAPAIQLAELGKRIAARRADVAIAFGSEAISTLRYLSASGKTRDWEEKLGGDIEDQGLGLEGIFNQYSSAHGVTYAPAAYGLLENARRARLGVSREAYAAAMGRLFAPFTTVAAQNSYSSSKIDTLSGQELVTTSLSNRIIADPYPRKLVARDQVNQAAAVLIMSVRAASDLGISQEKWIYVHGAAWATEKDIVERPDIGSSPAAEAALLSALSSARKRVGDIDYFDFYSCFPIAVFAAAVDGLGLDADDPRALTVTGGLPFFGGPGNNYSMHAIVSMSERLRADRGSFGLLGANGGWISKYAALVLSNQPCKWRPFEQDLIQSQLDSVASVPVTKSPGGVGTIETYTVIHKKGVPARAIIVGRLASGERFLANDADDATLAQMVETDPIGKSIFVSAKPDVNQFVFFTQT